MAPQTNGQETDFGILTAPVNGRGTWGALKALRASLRELRLEGTTEVIFIDALDGEGRAIALQDPNVVALVLGYRVRSGAARAS